MPFSARQFGLIGGGGVLLFVVGSFLPGVAPAGDDETPVWIRYLVENRSAILFGAVLTLTAVPLLLVGVAPSTADRVGTVDALALGAWVFAFGFLALSSPVMAAVAWRGPTALDASTVRFAVDVSHLALWGLSAGPAALAVVATTVALSRQMPIPSWLVSLAAVKVITSVVEIAGVGVTRG